MNKKTAEALAYFEHLFLPKVFYGDERDLVFEIHKNPNLLFDVFSLICKDNDAENPFSKENFSAETYRMDDEWFGTRIQFPEPAPDAPHCYELYLFHDGDLQRKAVFALEAAHAVDGSAGKLVSYLEETGTTRNFGGWPVEEQQDFFAGSLALYKKILAGEL